MSEQDIGRATDRRLDDAVIIDFLTSAAAILVGRGVISSKDTDNLRLVLSGLTAGSTNRTLMLALEHERAEYLELLKSRFGTAGLSLNLMRFSLRAPLTQMVQGLAEIGNHLLKRAELLFNRPFLLQVEGHPDRQVLFSTVIIDLVSTIGSTCTAIKTSLDEFSLMVPCGLPLSTPEDSELDAELANALGFGGLDSQSSPIFAAVSTKRNIAEANVNLALALGHLAEQLIYNTNAAAAHDLISTVELFRLESQRLGSLDLPRNESLVLWELRRKYVLDCVESVNSSISQLAAALNTALAVEFIQHKELITDASRRRLHFDLIASGLPAPRAIEAVETLLSYLRARNLKPDDLLPAEMQRIHPALTADTLATLCRLVNDSPLMTGAGKEKSQTLTKAARLSKVIQRVLTAGATIPLLVMLLPGCGLKTSPQSTISELRPDIPFHSSQPTNSFDETQRREETRTSPQAKAGGGINGNLERQPQ